VRVPGNFEVCWKCLSAKSGERAENAEQRVAQVDEHEQEAETPLADAETPQPEADDEELAVPTECSRCGSTKIIPGVTVVDQGKGSDGKLQAVIFGNPEALIFKDRLYSEILADICGKCGHVELRVANPWALYHHYRNSGVTTTWPIEDQAFAPGSETETNVTWEMKRLLRKAMSCERHGKYEEAVSPLEQFIAKADNADNIELARTHIRRIQERMSQRGGHVSV
jgi:ribosomal protein L31E